MKDTMLFKDHLKHRGLTDDIYCWIDYEKELVSFPLFNLTGEFIGYQRYDHSAPKIRSNNGRYYTYIGKKYRPDKRTPPIVFWGMEYFKSAEDILFVTEGVWDAVRVIEAGYPAIAILCNDPNRQFLRWFSMVSSHLITVALLDQGIAGDMLKKSTKVSLDLPVPDFNSFTPVEAKEFLGNESKKIGK